MARHHQLTITHGPLHEKDYRLVMINGHWGGIPEASTASRESSLMARSTWSITTSNTLMSR